MNLVWVIVFAVFFENGQPTVTVYTGNTSPQAAVEYHSKEACRADARAALEHAQSLNPGVEFFGMTCRQRESEKPVI